MPAPHPSIFAILVVVPLVIWRVYKRIRSMVGRQRLSRVRPWVHLVIFPAIVALLAYASHTHPDSLVWLAAGLCGGVALGVLGLRLTKFEATPAGLYYTPHAPLGIALSVLLVARIAWRIFEIYVLGTASVDANGDLARSPMTLSVFGVLAGYYIAYAAGLIRWRWRVLRAKREREQQALQARQPDGQARPGRDAG